MRYWDDTELEMIERNEPSSLVQRLLWKIRELQDENLALQVESDEGE